jgi:hypothetical protein
MDNGQQVRLQYIDDNKTKVINLSEHTFRSVLDESEEVDKQINIQVTMAVGGTDGINSTAMEPDGEDGDYGDENDGASNVDDGAQPSSRTNFADPVVEKGGKDESCCTVTATATHQKRCWFDASVAENFEKAKANEENSGCCNDCPEPLKTNRMNALLVGDV